MARFHPAVFAHNVVALLLQFGFQLGVHSCHWAHSKSHGPRSAGPVGGGSDGVRSALHDMKDSLFTTSAIRLFAVNTTVGVVSSYDVVKNTYFAINTLVLAISPVIHIGPATHNYMKEAYLSGDNHGPRTGDLH